MCLEFLFVFCDEKCYGSALFPNHLIKHSSTKRITWMKVWNSYFWWRKLRGFCLYTNFKQKIKKKRKAKFFDTLSKKILITYSSLKAVFGCNEKFLTINSVYVLSGWNSGMILCHCSIASSKLCVSKFIFKLIYVLLFWSLFSIKLWYSFFILWRQFILALLKFKRYFIN